MKILPTGNEVRARLNRVGRDGLTQLELVVFLVLYGNPLDALDAIDELLTEEALVVTVPAGPTGPKPDTAPALPGPVHVIQAARSVLRQTGRWMCTREIAEAVVVEDGVTADVTTTNVSVALQKEAKRGRIAKGPHPGNLRLVRWHIDPAAPVTYDTCPLCGRGSEKVQVA